MDMNVMGALKTKWKRGLVIAAMILDLTMEEGNPKARNYWANEVAPNSKSHVSAYEIHSVMI